MRATTDPMGVHQPDEIVPRRVRLYSGLVAAVVLLALTVFAAVVSAESQISVYLGAAAAWAGFILKGLVSRIAP